VPMKSIRHRLCFRRRACARESASVRISSGKSRTRTDVF
jgi:hypothetical protein